jgi:hypothetical protein
MTIDGVSLAQLLDSRSHNPYEINVINANEIKNILYLGIRGVTAKKLEALPKTDSEHTVDTFV